MTTMTETYLHVFDEYLTTTRDVAIALFGEDEDSAATILEELESDFELVKRVGDDSWMATPNQEAIDREEAEVNAAELPAGVVWSDTSEAVTESPEPSEAVLEPAPNAPYKFLHPDRARENFTDMVENAPSDAARSFWLAQLDLVPVDSTV